MVVPKHKQTRSLILRGFNYYVELSSSCCFAIKMNNSVKVIQVDIHLMTLCLFLLLLEFLQIH